MKLIFPILLFCGLPAFIVLGEATNALPVLTLPNAEEIALKQHPQIAQAN